MPFSQIESTAYVLPIIAKASDRFPESTQEASYFIVVPPRAEWSELGWEHKDLKEYKEKIKSMALDDLESD